MSVLRWLLFFSVLCAVASAHGQIYRWTDERGQTCYGDVAPPGVVVERCAVTPPPPPDPYARQRREEMQRLLQEWAQRRQQISAGGYERIEIVRPEPGDYVREQGDGIGIRIAVEPDVDIGAGHLVEVLLDGRPHGQASAELDRFLLGVDRGAHTVSARIVDAEGRTIAETPPVEFQYFRETHYHAAPYFVGPRFPGISPLLPPAGPARAAPNVPPPVHNYGLRSGPVQGPFRSGGPSVYQAPRTSTSQPARSPRPSLPPPPPGRQ